MASSREEQLRSNYRIARQAVGLIAIVLVVIGLFTVISWAVHGVSVLLDDSDRRQSYADRLYGLVMFDTLPFDDINSVDPSVFKQAAIWGCVYQIQSSGGSLDDYERDEETGSMILPKLEVDTYLSNLLGPDYTIEDGSFQTSEMNYIYDEERQGYLVPVTGAVGLYTPEVEDIRTQGGQLYVTVGYIPTLASTTSLTLTAPTEPTKYMDYVFTRGENRQWYLTALQESDMQPDATPTPAAASSTAPAQDPQTALENNLNSASSSTATDDGSQTDADGQTDASSADTGDSTSDTDTAAQDTAGTQSDSEPAGDSDNSSDTANPEE